MYASMLLPLGVERNHMSRLCIHQGTHVHPPWTIFSRESLDKMETILGKHHSVDPSATPSRLKNVAIGELISQFHLDSAIGLSDKDEADLWESLQVISTPQKFTSLLRSVRKDSKGPTSLTLSATIKRTLYSRIFNVTVFQAKVPKWTFRSFSKCQ